MQEIQKEKKLLVKSFPDTSRVWIYQSNRKFTDSELETIQKLGQQFVSNWKAHSQDLKSTFKIYHNLFLVFIVDETTHKASGCSIDTSVYFIKKVEEKFNVNMFDRMNVAYVNSNNEIELIHFSKIEEAISKGEINADTLIFNNTIQTKADLENNWSTPASKSWLKNYV